MTMSDSYDSLSSSSSRHDVTQMLQSIVDAPPFMIKTDVRERLAQALLNDVHQCATNGKGGKLTKKDAQLALLAIKTLGRVPAGSQIISKRDNLQQLLNISKSLRSTESNAADEALRCVANALLLVEEGRVTWAELHGAEYCVDLLETSTLPSLIFLTSRMLFLSTASPTSPLFPVLLGPSSQKPKRPDIIDTISGRLILLLTSILQGVPMSKEAMTDLLKFTFNLLVHWPKLDDSPDVINEAKSKGRLGLRDKKGAEKMAIDDGKIVMGDLWSERLDGLLAPLLRNFLCLPPTFPSPLSAPLTHTIHSLLTIPFNERLYSIWFPELPPPQRYSDEASSASPTNNSPTCFPDATLPSTTRSNSPIAAATIEKDGREHRGRFDRAMSMLTPRISLSSRSSSPAPYSRSPSPLPPSAERTVGSSTSSTPIPVLLTRAFDLLDVTLSYYLPDDVDPDDKTVRERCNQEDIKFDDLLSPLLLLLVNMCLASEECRRASRERLIPANLDRASPLEGRSDTLGRCIRLMTCVYHPRLKDTVGELLFTICDSDAATLSSHIGYGNAAGFLFNKGLMAPPLASQAASISSVDGMNSSINPITGMIEEPKLPNAEMSEEEKEREAEKLFVLFDRLEKAGGMENPIRKAQREGKLEKYNDKRNYDDDN